MSLWRLEVLRLWRTQRWLILLAVVSWVLRYADAPFYRFDFTVAGIHATGALSGKAILLFGGGLFLIWSGVKELRLKMRGVEHEAEEASRFGQVLFLVVSLNIRFSVDSILTVVGMTDIFRVMMGSVVISVVLMLIFAGPIATFMRENPDFEILGLFVLLLIGFVVLSRVQGRALLYLANLGSLMLVLQVLFMRFNVVVGGQLISKSERGFVDFPLEFFAREGVLTVTLIFVAPFALYYLISRFLPILEDGGEVEEETR